VGCECCFFKISFGACIYECQIHATYTHPRKMSFQMSAHVAAFVEDCLCDWYGEGNVRAEEPRSSDASHSFLVPGLYSVDLKKDGTMALCTSQDLGPSRVWTGMFLDLLVETAEKEFPDMQKRQMPEY